MVTGRVDVPAQPRKRKASSTQDEPRSKQTNHTNTTKDISIYHCADGELSEAQNRSKEGNMQTTVILATAKVRLQSGMTLSEPIRALMDAGGEVSVITQACAKRLNFKPVPCYMPLNGIGGYVGAMRKKIQVFIRPWFESDFVFPMDLYIIEQLNSILPRYEIRKENPPYDHVLADQDYNIPAHIELLLGAELWAEAVGSTVYKTGFGAMMQSSSLGCFALGKFTLINSEAAGVTILNASISEAENKQKGIEYMLLDEALKRFWEWEHTMSQKDAALTNEEKKVEEFFLESHYKNKEGRYVVHIPLKPKLKLGDSSAIARRRFYQLERRLQGNPSLRQAYIQLMREEQQAGHMQIATRPPTGMVYYIPHHPVLKKLRIVDDASCKTTNGLSLNDIQMIGPKLQFDLNDQIMRFRRHAVAFMADIRKMFKQVPVDKSQWDLMRIFWRESPQEELKEYWLTTVIFGMASSVYNACRAMIQCARDNAERFPEAAKAIEDDFYLDDCLSGAEILELAKVLCREIDLVLKVGGFELRNWNSNRREIERLMQSKATGTTVELDADDTTKLLGVNWDKKSDELAVRVNLGTETKADTKRKILSEIAKIYDPSGFLSPVVILAKFVMQDLWKEKEIGWDSSLKKTKYVKIWHEFYAQLHILSGFRIPRWLGTNTQAKIQLHGFSDASKKAYGCVIYVRTMRDNCINTVLLVAKSKVAPINPPTIPRLELEAAVMLSRLIKHTKQVLEMPNVNYYAWTDSTIVLHWLKKSPSELKQFVSSRIAVIQENTSIRSWSHIDTKQNPADLITRGMMPKELLASKLWLRGPEWLQKNRSEWPTPKLTITPETLKEIDNEIKPAAIFHLMSCAPLENNRGSLARRYSGWRKILRVTAIVLRFIHNARQKYKAKRRIGRSLSVKDTCEAVNYWAKLVQENAYKAEIECIRSADKQLPSKSLLAPLRPFLDENGVLRVGGRIGNAPVAFDRKHPIIIPAKTRIAYLILHQVHFDDHHAGVQSMMAQVRATYWIPKLRLECRKYLATCARCVRYGKRTETQIMGNLPEVRVKPAEPFVRSGVDMAGPFMVRPTDGRTYKI